MINLLQEIQLNSNSRESLYLYLKNKYQLSSHLNHKLIILNASSKQVLKIGWSIWNADEIKEE